MNRSITTERRACRPRSDMTVDQLLKINIESARCQLGVAREDLIAARRRVVALEGAVANWIEVAEMTEANAHQTV